MNAARRRRFRRRNNQGNQQNQREAPREPHVPKTYAVVFYESPAEAKADQESLAAKAKDVGQLNIVIKTDCDMDDPDLTQYGKVFAGEAWTLIHERRVQEGWYDSPH